MDDLLEWLRAQLAEDERIARAADPELSNIFSRVEVFDSEMAADERHVMLHNPARVLREIDAKRRVLARHHAAPVPPGSEQMAEFPYCAAHAYTQPDGVIVYPVELKNCPERRLLALPYADRPGYREEWRP
ncbi:DUF6221 family protein [Streptomyces sp. DSM 41014]|uniref:DUF6221 family protein n=1 Tax=Streptomyces hintoniae TaxID=3075521 RepID=A0ABU2USH6_9ACTN|nr:DUF6221 family protein [Streptomyces sp. DSM 41014]MDT0476227.1 DUF6221 family protein [Streptomyces sp. DSM 41014]